MSTNHHPPPQAPDPTSTSSTQNAAFNTAPFTLPNNSSHRLSTQHLTNGNIPYLNGDMQANNPQHHIHKSHVEVSQQLQHHFDMTCQHALRPALPYRDFHSSQAVIEQLQEINKGQSEQITELRIKVAVLENELMHAKQDKDAVSNSMGIVIESLARFHTSASASSAERGNQSREVGLSVSMGNLTAGADMGGARTDVKGLEKEIDRLRRENRVLRRREKEIGYAAAMKALLGEDGEQHVHFRSGTPVAGSSAEKGKGKERVLNGADFENSFQSSGGNGEGLTSEHLIGSWGNSDPSFQHGGNGNANGLTSKDLIGSWGNPSFAVREAGPSNLNNSFGSGSTTVPNTPLLNATSFDASFADVGLHSLEENMDMDNDGFPPALSFPSSKSDPNHPSNTPSANRQNGEEEEKDIDEQLLDHQSALQKFHSLPKPSVLHVGFSLEGTKRGEDYDSHPLRAPPSYQRQGSMRYYDRFGTNPPPAGPRALRHDSDLALKIPADLSGEQGLWEGNEERKEAVEIHMRCIPSRDFKQESRFPDFFRYGISYLPSSTDSNYLRTVMLSNLPVGTELRDVLSRVRGGEVLSASLLDTKTIMGGLSARVVFRHEAAAEEYTLYCNSHPIIFPSDDEEDGEKKAEVTLLTTPTYPLNPRALSRLNAHAQTRCLSLPNFPPSFSLNALERHLSCGNGVRGSMLIEYFIDEEGTLHLQFSDVQWAGAAYGRLINWQTYRGLDVLFSNDPCAGPVEDLSLPVAPRPSMLPKNWSEIQGKYAAAASLDNGGGVGGEILTEQRKRVAALEDRDGRDGELVREVEGMQRKRLAALSCQKVEILSFSGNGIQGDSWADEVIEELESESPPPPPASTSEMLVEGMIVPPNSPTHGFAKMEKTGGDEVERGMNAILIENVNEMMFQGSSNWWKDEGLRHPPIGLAGSKYASVVPSFSDNGTDPTFRRQGNPNHHSISASSSTHSPQSNSFPAHDTTNNPELTNATFLPDNREEHNASASESSLPLPSCQEITDEITRNIEQFRLQMLTNQPSPSLQTILNINPKKLNKSPPKVNLHDLLASSPSASPTSSNPSSPPSNLHPRKRKHELYDEINGGGGMEEPVRMPRGPSKYGFGGKGFGKGKGYDSEEAETDELNLLIPSHKLALDALDSLSPVSEVEGKGVNPDEIELSLSDEDAEDEELEVDVSGGREGEEKMQDRVEERIVRELVSA